MKPIKMEKSKENSAYFRHLTAEWLKATISGIPFDRLKEICNAEREKRCIALPLDGADFERVCEAVHDAWWAEKLKQGTTHPDMIPYSELSGPAKEYDRVTVRTVLDSLTRGATKMIEAMP